ncbi:MAG: pntA [bacterium]|nr:pntA [bacterium]
MKVGVLKETAAGEKRVALFPETIRKLAARRIDAIVERGAGLASGVTDVDYEAAGAIIGARADVLARCDTLLQVARPSTDELERLQDGRALVSLQYPLSSADFVRAALRKRLLTIALDMIPRTTLAQSMDVLSSQANLAGYWAVVAAAARLPKIFPLLMTAAGTIAPARVLVMGTGVAGLQAIGTAHRLGALVEATDVRPETREQVESLGGRFLSVVGVAVKEGTGGYAAEQSEEYQRKQAELIAEAIARADVVITTALVPGKLAPRLITDAHLASMRPRSVVVDLAAEQGGNVEGSQAGAEVQRHGATVIGALSAPSHVAFHASQAFSRNLEKLLAHLTDAGAWKLDPSDEITRGCVITRDGELVQPKVREALAATMTAGSGGRG